MVSPEEKREVKGGIPTGHGNLGLLIFFKLYPPRNKKMTGRAGKTTSSTALLVLATTSGGFGEPIKNRLCKTDAKRFARSHLLIPRRV